MTLLERAVSAVALVALFPAFAILSAVICVLSGKTPLIAVLRVGRYGTPLWVIKFRTLWNVPRKPGVPALLEHVVDEHGPARKDDHDPRITSSFARFCRRFSIDELPQLWHVVRGEMSLVGPRPLTRSELLEYYGPDAVEILAARPGITGLWQVSGRNSLSYEQRRDLDLELVRSLTPALYVRILLRTIPSVLTGADSC
jgi:lipopolysaccharide/colanic/teichoic acid biosynthesis glycosyltransferase